MNGLIAVFGPILLVYIIYKSGLRKSRNKVLAFRSKK